MVNPTEFYKHVKTNIFPSLRTDPIGIRVSGLLDGVIQDLPDEEQFKTKGTIWIYKRKEAIDFWNMSGGPGELFGYSAPFENPRVDGHCVFHPSPMFDIFIIVDGDFDLDQRTDGYIKGVIVWELARLSYYWKITKNIQTQEQDENKAITDEAKRLGFEEDLFEMQVLGGTI